MPTSTINNLYIESLYIDNNNDNGMLTTDGYNGENGGDISNYSLGNHLTGASFLNTDLNVNYGSKWVVQLTNGSGSTITFNTGSNKWWLRLDIKHKDSSNGFTTYSSITTKRFYIEGGTLSNGASLYLGWANTDTDKGIYGTASGISNIDICSVSSNVPTGSLDGKLIPPVNDDSSVSAYRLLPDQIDGTGNTICTVRFLLYKSSSLKDYFGDVTNDGSGLNYSSKRHILFTSGANNVGSSRSVSTGAISRDPTESGTVPNTTFDSTKFVYRSGSGDSILGGTAVGDPHITTLYGITYKFDYLGDFRLFDNNNINPKNRIVVNGVSELGKGLRWKDKQYIKRLFICHGNKYALIDTGFRGEKAKIIKNNGLQIEEKELEFDETADVHCYDCTREINYNEGMKIWKHKVKNKHDIKYAVRNLLTLTIKLNDEDKIIMTVSNVNEYNLQPCRINIKINSYILNNLSKFSGCIVDRKYALTCALDNISSLETINRPEIKKLKNIPKIEINPSIINKKFC